MEASHEQLLRKLMRTLDSDGDGVVRLDMLGWALRAGAGAGAAADAPKERQKARYIGAIMEAHKEREIENDKLFERKMQKEAEAEAHLYGDKERFMTSAYKKKLAAREEYEAAQKAKEAADAANDVTKRADLSGFYSNLLHGTLAGDAKQGGSAALDAAYSLTSGAR